MARSPLKSSLSDPRPFPGRPFRQTCGARAAPTGCFAGQEGIWSPPPGPCPSARHLIPAGPPGWSSSRPWRVPPCTAAPCARKSSAPGEWAALCPARLSISVWKPQPFRRSRGGRAQRWLLKPCFTRGNVAQCCGLACPGGWLSRVWGPPAFRALGAGQAGGPQRRRKAGEHWPRVHLAILEAGGTSVPRPRARKHLPESGPWVLKMKIIFFVWRCFFLFLKPTVYLYIYF